MLAHPEIAGRSCEDCKRWVYDDKRDRLSSVRVMKSDGQPMPRVVKDSMPCRMCPKIPKGLKPCPENAIELSERSNRAYWHYLQCKAVGRFPDDPIVRRDAGLIRMVEDEVERERMDLLPLLAMGKG